MRKYLIFCILSSILFSCNQDLKINRNLADEFYSKMKDGEVKSLIQFDHELFYSYKNNFKGKLIITKNNISSNLFDQFESNFTFRFKILDWKTPKPINISILASDNEDSKYDKNIMIGKMLNKKENIGLGYVMREGEISIEELSKDKCIILLKGKVARYSSAVNKPELWKPFTGVIIYKKPDFLFEEIKETEVFF